MIPIFPTICNQGPYPDLLNRFDCCPRITVILNIRSHSGHSDLLSKSLITKCRHHLVEYFSRFLQTCKIAHFQRLVVFLFLFSYIFLCNDLYFCIVCLFIVICHKPWKLVYSPYQKCILILMILLPFIIQFFVHILQSKPWYQLLLPLIVSHYKQSHDHDILAFYILKNVQNP